MDRELCSNTCVCNKSTHYHEICALLGNRAAYSGNYLPTSVTNCLYTLRFSQEIADLISFAAEAWIHSLPWRAHYQAEIKQSPSFLYTRLTHSLFIRILQGGSNMTGTDLYVNKPHCAAAVRPWESEATTSTLSPALVRTCSVLSGSC